MCALYRRQGSSARHEMGNDFQFLLIQAPCQRDGVNHEEHGSMHCQMLLFAAECHLGGPLNGIGHHISQTQEQDQALRSLTTS